MKRKRGRPRTIDAEPIGHITRRCGESFKAKGRFDRICLPCKWKPWFNNGVQDFSAPDGRWLSAAATE